MISEMFTVLLYQPLYNGLVFLISVLPFGDVGLAVIILTVLVKSAILPLTHKSVKAQARMRAIEPEIKKTKERFKDDKQEQMKKVMELYKTHGVNPFSGCVLFIVQIPIIFALYWVFWKGLTNGLDGSNLYSFLDIPEVMNMNFLGFIDLAGKSVLLAFSAGVSQYFQIQLATPKIVEETPKEGPPSFQDEFAKSFRLQMKYGFPFVIFFVAYTISSAVALYWTVSNVFSIVHEIFVRQQAARITSPTSKNT